MPKYLKYANIISDFLPNYTAIEYSEIVHYARKDTRKSGQTMNTLLSVDTYFKIYINYFEWEINVVKKEKGKFSESDYRRRLDDSRHRLDRILEEKEDIIKQMKKGSLSEYEALLKTKTSIATTEVFCRSSHLKTIGDFNVAYYAYTIDQFQKAFNSE